MQPYIRYRRTLTARAQALRRESTRPERKLWYEYLRMRPERFTRQKPLGEYIADFYCSSRRLVVELDGDSHFIEAAQRYDSMRTDRLRALGIRVIRFTNEEVLDAFESVCLQIEQELLRI